MRLVNQRTATQTDASPLLPALKMPSPIPPEHDVALALRAAALAKTERERERALVAALPQVALLCAKAIRSFRFIRNPADVEDIVQDAVVKVWRAFDQLNPHSNAAAWVMRIARNTAIDFMRRKDHPAAPKTNTLLGLPSCDVLFSKTDHKSIEPCEVLIQEEFKSLFLSTLSALQRETALLKSEGFSYEEIAAAQIVSINTVKTRLRSVRLRLENAIASAAQEP